MHQIQFLDCLEETLKDAPNNSCFVEDVDDLVGQINYEVWLRVPYSRDVKHKVIPTLREARTVVQKYGEKGRRVGVYINAVIENLSERYLKGLPSDFLNSLRKRGFGSVTPLPREA